MQQNNPIDMEALLVVAEEEYIEPSKSQAVTGIMKIRTSKKDYMRVDQKAQRQNRFAPEIALTFHDKSTEVKTEESKETALAGCSVTCSECSYGLPLKTIEKQEKA